LSWYGGKFVVDTTISISAPTGTIYYTIDGSDPRLVGGTVSASAKIYSGTVISLTDTTTIKTRVKSGSDWSAMVKADYTMIPYNIPDGLESVKPNISNIYVYPNPAKNFAYFIFDLPVSGKVDIEIYSMNGKLVSKVWSGYRPEGTNTIPWIISNTIPGLYFYRISGYGLVKTGKLLVIE
jgi:hypothetical protein